MCTCVTCILCQLNPIKAGDLQSAALRLKTPTQSTPASADMTPAGGMSARESMLSAIKNRQFRLRKASPTSTPDNKGAAASMTAAAAADGFRFKDVQESFSPLGGLQWAVCCTGFGRS